MFFIWGAGHRRKYTNVYTQETCGKCGKTSKINIISDYDYGSMFFIPIVKYRENFFAVCPHCKSYREIKKKEFKAIKSGKTIFVVDEKKDIAVTKEAEKSTKKNENEKDKIIQEVSLVLEELKRRNVVINSSNKQTFKNILKEQLLEKFKNEKLIEEVIEDRFKDIK